MYAVENLGELNWEISGYEVVWMTDAAAKRGGPGRGQGRKPVKQGRRHSNRIPANDARATGKAGAGLAVPNGCELIDKARET